MHEEEIAILKYFISEQKSMPGSYFLEDNLLPFSYQLFFIPEKILLFHEFPDHSSSFTDCFSSRIVKDSSKKLMFAQIFCWYYFFYNKQYWRKLFWKIDNQQYTEWWMQWEKKIQHFCRQMHIIFLPFERMSGSWNPWSHKIEKRLKKRVKGVKRKS